MIILLMVICASHAIAQSNVNNPMPTAVTTAFTTKYPNATIKNWNVINDEYTAKAKDDHHKYYATFDKNGTWLKTTTKFNWPWHLSPVVRKAFKKSEYGAWHIYGINIIETPAGEFYQVLVDDANHQADALHQEIFTRNRVLEFKPDGELIKGNNINETSML